MVFPPFQFHYKNGSGEKSSGSGKSTGKAAEFFSDCAENEISLAIFPQGW